MINAYINLDKKHASFLQSVQRRRDKKTKYQKDSESKPVRHLINFIE